MLELTSSAATTIADARARNGLPEHFAVRISAGGASDGSGSAFQLGFAEEPHDDDLVGEAEGTRYFVAAEVAEPLEGAVLDVQDTAEGPGFVLKRQV